MNISDNSSSTAWTNVTSTSSNMTANASEPQPHDLKQWHQQELNLTSDSSVTRTATLITGTQPSNYTWPLWMFFTVAVTLTLGSIIIPLIIGRVYRMVVRFARRETKKFRLILSVLWIM